MLRMAEISLGLRPASKGDVDVRLSKLDAAALAAAIESSMRWKLAIAMVPPAGTVTL